MSSSKKQSVFRRTLFLLKLRESSMQMKVKDSRTDFLITFIEESKQEFLLEKRILGRNYFLSYRILGRSSFLKRRFQVGIPFQTICRFLGKNSLNKKRILGRNYFQNRGFQIGCPSEIQEYRKNASRNMGFQVALHFLIDDSKYDFL